MLTLKATNTTKAAFANTVDPDETAAFANTVDPDETAHDEPSNLAL